MSLIAAASRLAAWIDSIPPDIQLGIRLLAGFIGLLWVLELIDTLLLRGAFNRFGIQPRRLKGLVGIPLAPLLHGNLGHLAANTGPLAILGSLILLGGLRSLLMVTGIAWLVSGVGVWLLGRSRTNHIGASSLVFGYLGFLLLRGYFERSPLAISLAVLVGLLYGSALWGLLPLQRGRSWAGHAFGVLGGALAARYWLMLTAS
ncbi:rhomboid family intramembrane serine protease [filamentous cyanobacterium CCP5]|nr:rhomboid family intramembrane serine protease [filamentous cyanobacterium CCP5]